MIILFSAYSKVILSLYSVSNVIMGEEGESGRLPSAAKADWTSAPWTKGASTMILYRLARWMEELTRIRRLIRLSTGDVKELVQEKEQVKRQMLTYAETWIGLPASASLVQPAQAQARSALKAPVEPLFALSGLSLPHDDEELAPLIAAVAQYPTYTNEEVVEA
ncbi:MAG: hypothetical protein K0R75_2698 [Paenibacillaceae bacterium]|jgi:hypothetical protein|nr:hypothetical protein [Paenibacillaceae bacterium]